MRLGVGVEWGSVVSHSLFFVKVRTNLADRHNRSHQRYLWASQRSFLSRFSQLEIPLVKFSALGGPRGCYGVLRHSPPIQLRHL